MKIEQIERGMNLTGVDTNVVVSVKSIFLIAPDVWELTYRLPDGSTREQMIRREDETRIQPATHERPFTFDGDPARFKLVCEAKRIDMAFLFDPMLAVHTSNVEPLPHQITAVYESMLPHQPLRFVLADDPGAGKTIMAGLYLRELIMRADAYRILIIAPGSLVEQWRDELFEKFNLTFSLFSSEVERASPSNNPFEHQDRWIVRLDQISRNSSLQEKLCASEWDLVIFDEAHKLAAHYLGNEIRPTKRFEFAQKIAEHTRHLLLMTATPHNGKEEDFQLFLSLLDADRFYGKFRNGVHKVEVSDLMRRMVKEELVRFDGTPLFPERKAYTVNYALSSAESALYENVTHYVRTEMGKADQLDGKRKNSVGFALTTLQRRLASSPEAIFQSIRRRRERLEKRLQQEKENLLKRKETNENDDDIPEADDELNAAQQEALEEKLLVQATAARTIQELDDELRSLKELETQAKSVVVSGQDRKWDELSRLLQHEPAMRPNDGGRRKLILFTEHRDTLSYLQRKISGLLGRDDAIVTIHGATPREQRLLVQGQFRNDPDVFLLLATDAAGEGVNLQTANLMVNYDLPWNPNRLEQRFGRIHRIGQVEVCHLWNLVAKETREGDVYHRLLEKLQIESDALRGRVFDILGEVFEENSLKDLLIEAIRYGDLPEVRAKLTQKIDQALDHKHLQQLLQRNALAQEVMDPLRLFAIREEMEKAEARKLQPFFVRSFFLEAANDAKINVHPRESSRYQITNVPAILRSTEVFARLRGVREPIQKAYERICFEKEAVQPLHKPGLHRAELFHPGHPLMRLLTQQLLEKEGHLLRQGTLFIDANDEHNEPWLLFLALHELKTGQEQSLSKQLHFVRISPHTEPSFAGWAPHLDLEPLPPHERPLVQPILQQEWLAHGIEQKALSFVASHLAPLHLREVEQRHRAHIQKTREAVHIRLSNEILYQQTQFKRFKEEQAAGKDLQLQINNTRRRILELQDRLDLRKKELDDSLHVRSATPIILGAALVLPLGLMRTLRGEITPEQSNLFATQALARQRIERIAMHTVQQHQEQQGWRVVDVSAEKCGWDLTAYPPPSASPLLPRHIEVKGRAHGATTLTVTRNEILYALNQGDYFVLAIVFVHPDDTTEGPFYLERPFDREPDWGADSVNYSIRDLLKKSVAKARVSS